MGITISNIQKKFGDFTALKDVSLDIKSGELVALLGPSGSGKTTLLRIIAGLEHADAGTVILNGENTQRQDIGERNVGFVFQHYALFKHMTVFDNVAFGLKVRPKSYRPSEGEIRDKVFNLLKLVHLDDFYNRYPAQLSGGQRQRVALARALAVEPKVLLLDEPFGALDAKVRKELRRWMRRLHDEIHITSVFVTHDQEEAMEVADRVVVMSNGLIEQVGTPEDIWNKPVNGFVYNFLGNYNAFEGWKEEDGTIHLTEYNVVSIKPSKNRGLSQSRPDWRYRHSKTFHFLRQLLPSFIPGNEKDALAPSSAATALSQKEKSPKGKAVKLYARPHEMVISRKPNGHDCIVARIIHINPAGPLVKLELERRNGNVLQAEVPAETVESLQLKKGEEVLVYPKTTRVFE